MAKVIRNCWVYKKNNKVVRTLPRRNDRRKEYDFEKNAAGPDHFPERMDGDPPKLWLVWLFRATDREPKWTRQRVKNLFGDDPQVGVNVNKGSGSGLTKMNGAPFAACFIATAYLQPGKMTIFMNTAAWNAELWHVKHLIELHPITFPNGEPTMEDINHLELFPDGRCVINKSLQFDEAQLQLVDPRKQFTPGQLAARLGTRWGQKKDVFEDTVYTPKNISVID